MKKFGLVTGGRADWSLWKPIVDELQKCDDIDLRLYATCMHLSQEYGNSLNELESEGYKFSEKIKILDDAHDSSPHSISKAIGRGCLGFGDIFARAKPDLLLVLGDRFESFAAAGAALPFKIPVAHFYGGEVTMGAIDDALRNAITKLSHIHFTSNESYRDRVVNSLGEEAWRVHAVGATSIDQLKKTPLLSRDEFFEKYNLENEKPFALVTYHPATLEYEDTQIQITNLLRALEKLNMQILFTAPNADTGGKIILEAINDFQKKRNGIPVVKNLGVSGYYSALRHTAVVIGNSSSGLVEAPSFEVPVVNIGNRQKGRVRGSNVIDVSGGECEIFEACKRALASDFCESLKGITNPYGDGLASGRIVNILREIKLDSKLLIKGH